MHRRAILARVGSSIAATAALTHAASGAVRAAEASAAPAATTQTTTPVFTDPIQLLNAIALLLLFAVIVTGLIVLYLRQAQDRYFLASERLGRLGIVTSPEVISTTAAAATGSLESAAAAGAATSLTVTGPTRLTVGVAAEYQAAAEGGDLATTAWAATPDDALELSATTGERITVTPRKPGPASLTVTLDGNSVAIVVTVEPAPTPTRGTTLPFVGAGFGSVLAAVIIAVLITILGIARVLGPEAIASLLGTLAGYLFGLRVGGGGGSQSGAGGQQASTEGD